MIELLIVLALASVLWGPVLGLIALLRTREIRRLRERLDALEAAVANVERRARTTETPAAAPVVPKPTPPSSFAPAPAPTPAPAASPRPIPPPAPPPPPKAARIEWERWIGIRGAAALGGIVLALAGLLFFQYSIQHGLITPPMRVVLGVVVGLGCLVGSEILTARAATRTRPSGSAGRGS